MAPRKIDLDSQILDAYKTSLSRCIDTIQNEAERQRHIPVEAPEKYAAANIPVHQWCYEARSVLIHSPLLLISPRLRLVRVRIRRRSRDIGYNNDSRVQLIIVLP